MTAKTGTVLSYIDSFITNHLMKTAIIISVLVLSYAAAISIAKTIASINYDIGYLSLYPGMVLYIFNIVIISVYNGCTQKKIKRAIIFIISMTTFIALTCLYNYAEYDDYYKERKLKELYRACGYNKNLQNCDMIIVMYNKMTTKQTVEISDNTQKYINKMIKEK